MATPDTSFTTDSAGTVGAVKPGWSITEGVTPISPADSSGTTGGVSLTTGPGVDSDLLIESFGKFSSTGVGTVWGYVNNVETDGSTDSLMSDVGISVDTNLAQLNATRTVPSYYGSLSGYFDTLFQSILYTPAKTFQAGGSGYYFPLKGNYTGYSFGGATKTGGMGSFYSMFPIIGALGSTSPLLTPHVGSNGFVVTGGASTADFSTWPTGLTTANNQRAVFQWLVNVTGSTSISMDFSVGPGPSAPTYGNYCSWAYNGTTLTVSAATFGVSVSTATLDTSQPIMISFSIDPSTQKVFIRATDHNLLSVFTNTTTTYGLGFNGLDVYIQDWAGYSSATANLDVVSANAYQLPAGTTVPAQYMTVDPYVQYSTFSGANPTIVAPAFTANIWQKLKDLCSAYDKEIGFAPTTSGTAPFGATVIRDIAQRTLDISNAVASSTKFTLDSAQSASALQATNYNTTFGTGTIYNALQDNRIFSVAVGERRTDTIQTTNYPFSITPPNFVLANFGSYIPGNFQIVDSTGIIVTPQVYAASQMGVTATINKTIPGAIDITFQGPMSAFPGTAGPYYFAYQDGFGSRVSAFSLTGTGIFTTPVQVNILSGADTTVTADNRGPTVDNIYFDSLQRVYDRMIWATQDYSSGQMTLNITVPTSSLNGLVASQIAGSMISYRDSLYRVTNAVTSLASVQITATRRLTAADFDAKWLGIPATGFDAYWSGKKVKDVKIKSLRTNQLLWLYPSTTLFPSTGLYPGLA